MIKKNYLLIFTLISIAFVVQLIAAPESFGDKVNGVLFSPVSSRAASLAEAVTADTASFGNFIYNPAALRGVNYFSYFAGYSYIVKGFNLINAGVGLNTKAGNFGAVLKFLSSPSVSGTEYVSGNLVNGITKIKGSDFYLNMGYSHSLGQLIEAGLGVYYLGVFDNTSINTLGFNIGTLIGKTDSKWHLGVSLKNLGLKVKGEGENFSHPLSLAAGFHFNPIQKEQIDLSVLLNGETYFSKSLSLSLGADLKIKKLVNVRLGYQFFGPNQGFSSGLGLTYKGIGVDYGLSFTDLAAVNSVAIRQDILKKRRQAWEIQEGERVRLAVNDLILMGVSSQLGAILTDLIQSELIKHPVFHVIERAALQEVMKEQELQLTGCTDEACAVEIGKLLSVSKMILGEASKLGENYLVSIRIIDIETGTAEFSAKHKFADINKADEEIEALIGKLLEQVLPEDMR